MLSSIRSFSPLIRAVFVIGAVAALVSSITFAALSDTATLAESTMSTTNAELQIYNFPNSAWENSAPGFAFNNLVPGTFSSPSSFYLKNAGGVNLDVAAMVPTAPTLGAGFTGTLADIKVAITGDECTTTVNTDMDALVAGAVALPCNSLDVGEAGDSGIALSPGNFKISVKIEAGAVTGSGPVNVGAFDIIFTGTQVLAS
jgi:archaellum component FlaG (FlaF/FlaG flagellin family)